MELNYRIRDLTGQRFDMWHVLRFLRTEPVGKKNSIAIWLCRCDCGTEREVRGSDLKQGNSKGCGCRFGRDKDLTGQRFGRLVVLSESEERTTTRKGRHWLCQCDCGETSIAPTKYLTNGDTKSCGCGNIAAIVQRNTTHGKSDSAEYATWSGIITRCENPNATGYENYGGRGITVCQRWRDSFEAFLEDMGSIPDGADSIDRIDGNKGYEPGNCRWTTNLQQANNKRNNVRLTHNGKTQTVPEWARELGIKAANIHRRLGLGWSVEDALST